MSNLLIGRFSSPLFPSLIVSSLVLFLFVVAFLVPCSPFSSVDASWSDHNDDDYDQDEEDDHHHDHQQKKDEMLAEAGIGFKRNPHMIHYQFLLRRHHRRLIRLLHEGLHPCDQLHHYKARPVSHISLEHQPKHDDAEGHERD